LVAAQETVRAAQAGVDRAEVIVKTITAQVEAQLRPGADQSRAEAELAAARTQLIQAQQAIEISRATFSQFTGADPSQISIVAGSLVQLPREQAAPVLNTTANPMIVEQNAAVEQARAQLRALERSYFPRFYLKAQLTPAERAPKQLAGAWAASTGSGQIFRTTRSVSQ
jgi:outer membrane protein